MYVGDFVLEQLERFGKGIAERAELNHWAHEDHHRAKAYAAALPHVRRAYADLRAGVSWQHVLPALKDRLGPLAGGVIGAWSIHRMIDQCEHDDAQDNR